METAIINQYGSRECRICKSTRNAKNRRAGYRWSRLVTLARYLITLPDPNHILEGVPEMLDPVTVYVVATSHREALELVAKSEALQLADYGDAVRLLRQINQQPHPGINYRIFAVPKPVKLDGR